MSDQVINELTNDIVNYISSLFKISEGIALLDMVRNILHLLLKF